MTFVVPDAIEPVVGWRTWRVVDGLLHSQHYGGTWMPGEAAKATCHDRKTPDRKWLPVPIEDAIESGLPMVTDRERDEDGDWNYGKPPRLLLPPEMAYVWDTPPRVEHTSPHEKCTCGVYAADHPEICQQYRAPVLGRVSLWGKVVPGTNGWRAEFAYPSELFVLDELPAATSFFSIAMFSTMPNPKPLAAGREESLHEYGVPVTRVATWQQAVKMVRTAA